MSYEGIVAAFHDVLGTFDLIVVSPDNLVLGAEYCVTKTKGLVQVSHDGGIGTDQAVLLSIDSIVVSMELVSRPFDHIGTFRGGWFGRSIAEEAVHVEETV